MKRIAWVVLLGALATAGFAQSAGSILLSGGSNGSFSKDLLGSDYSDQWTTVDFWGQGGYFVADGLELGPYLSYHWESEKNASADTTRQYRNAYIGLQAGYFLVTGTRFNPFIQLMAAYRSAKDTYQTGDVITYENSWNAIIAQLRLGLDIMLSDAVALVAGTYLQYYKPSEWEGSFDLRVFFGLDVFLGPFTR